MKKLCDMAILIGLVLFCKIVFTAEPSVDEIRLRVESTKVDQWKISDRADLCRLAGSESMSTSNAKATAVLAFIYRRSGEKSNDCVKNQERLAKFALKADGLWNYSNAECCLEYARLIAKTDWTSAQKVFDYFGKGSDALLKILSAEAAGDTMLEFEKFQEAIEHYRFARRYAKSDEYAMEEKRVEFALKRIEANMQKAKQSVDLAKYGEEFVLYREAEQQRKWSNYKRAIPLYEDIIKRFPQTVFARAAELYVGYCFEKVGNTKEAEARWKKIIKGDPQNPYRPEALIALAEFQLRA